MNKYKLNYKFNPDHTSDIKYSFSSNIKLPASFSLKDSWGDIYDQGELGSCTSNAVAGTVRHTLKTKYTKDVNPSRLFIYYNGRRLQGYDVNYDSGLFIRDGCKSINKYGVCTEESWKYDISKFAIKPPESCYSEAIRMKNKYTYFNLSNDLTSIKACIYEGYPVAFGILIYESFFNETTARTGTVTMPNIYIEKQLGGHAMTIIGFNDKTEMFTVANSWGEAWGDSGFCYIPYGYIADKYFSGDFCTIRIYCGIKMDDRDSEDSLDNTIDNILRKKVKDIIHRKLDAIIDSELENMLK